MFPNVVVEVDGYENFDRDQHGAAGAVMEGRADRLRIGAQGDDEISD